MHSIHIFTIYYVFHMQYSVFGSILTIGAMIGAIMSGRITDIIGRKRVRIINFVFQVRSIPSFRSSHRRLLTAGNGSIRPLLYPGMVCNNMWKGLHPHTTRQEITEKEQRIIFALICRYIPNDHVSLF